MSLEPASLAERVRHDLPALPAAAAAEVARAIERIVEAFQPERIYVFGSYARGTPTPDSDVDIMVVVEQSDLPPHRRDQAALRVIGSHRTPMDILVLTREEFDRRLGAVASLPSTVVREGKLLYAA